VRDARASAVAVSDRRAVRAAASAAAAVTAERMPALPAIPNRLAGDPEPAPCHPEEDHRGHGEEKGAQPEQDVTDAQRAGVPA
jgi:hypothetical protein